MKAGARQIALDVPVESAWAALVSGDRRNWYYRLTPEGEFAAGNHIRWADGEGKVLEESEVVEVNAPARLVLETRFLFAPNFAAEKPHLVTWTVEEVQGGCRVEFAWRSGDAVGGLFEAEAESILRGLRVALDPAEQAALARLPEIGAIEVHDVTPERVAEYQSFFDDYAFRDYPAWQSCYCMETHRTQSDDEWAGRTAADNRRDMTAMINRGEVTALLAFVDGKAVGWCNYGETTRLAGVMHRFGLKAAAHEGVGSVACFVIAAPYRGHGVASRLLDAALDRLRKRGLSAVEGYPAKKQDSAQGNYRGPLSMYLRAGFEVVRETGDHAFVRKLL
ncbi:MAG TPA: GNAT family N-acetyltransferase [Candidatus Nitrosotalea sp.]|nr:GNAT family N-acetyltransferase [Candidatus Nitrosotalea sp.]